MPARRDAVTGAFGFTGRAIAERLLDAGRDVLTLTRRSGRGDPLAARIEAVPLDFGRPDLLPGALSGVDTLFNTYWIRFPRGGETFERAIAESTVLIGAAREAGVRRLVHVSVVGADPAGPTPYVRAKGVLEGAVERSGLEWSIVRPTLTYGPDDILVNNLAWALRHLPVYGMPGDGRYPIQPVHVDDVARICIESAEARPGTVVDAGGPETFAYRDMVAVVRTAVRSRAVVMSMPAPLVLAAGRILGLLLHDVVLTPDEIRELTCGWLASAEPPRGRIDLRAWVSANGRRLGCDWSSELARNYRIGDRAESVDR
jgi:NADH dehydrogenase